MPFPKSAHEVRCDLCGATRGLVFSPPHCAHFCERCAKHMSALVRPDVTVKVTDELVERVWGHYSHPGDDATEEEELAAMRAALVAAFSTECRTEKTSSRMCERGTKGCVVEHGESRKDAPS